jgi:plasmid stabilization system protein ParE
MSGVRSTHIVVSADEAGVLATVARERTGVVTREELPMPQQAWSAKRERQYEHIKSGLKQRGDSEELAEEIAARTVNKERARHGESKTQSPSSTKDISSGRRGGLRSHRGAGGRTRDQLYQEAKRMRIAGRSTMTKAQLERAVDRSIVATQ